jgi:hypothetical protein
MHRTLHHLLDHRHVRTELLALDEVDPEFDGRAPAGVAKVASVEPVTAPSADFIT